MGKDEIELALNRIAQLPAVRWQDAAAALDSRLSNDERVVAMHVLQACLFQAHPTVAELEASVRASTSTRQGRHWLAQIERGDAVREIVHRLARTGERAIAWRVMTHLFGLADTRRRETRCRGTCTHWWHRLPPA